MTDISVPGKRERNARARRTSLLEAGERLGRQKGWPALSVEDITDAQEWQKATSTTISLPKRHCGPLWKRVASDDVAGQIPVIALSSDPVSGTAGYMSHLVDLASSTGPEGVRRLLALVSQTDGEEGGRSFFHSPHTTPGVRTGTHTAQKDAAGGPDSRARRAHPRHPVGLGGGPAPGRTRDTAPQTA